MRQLHFRLIRQAEFHPALRRADEMDVRRFERWRGEGVHSRRLTLSAGGKSAGTFCVTLPVTAHSAPRWNVTMNPTHCCAVRLPPPAWPSAVWKTRPWPNVVVISIGSCRPVPFGHLGDGNLHYNCFVPGRDRADAMARQSSQIHPFTRLAVERMTPEERIRLIEMLWEVAYADGEIDPLEDAVIRKTAELLYVDHSEFIRAKLQSQ